MGGFLAASTILKFN